MGIKEIKKYCAIDDNLKNFIGLAIEKYKLSARAYHSILKVARTVADLADSENIKQPHIAQTLQYIKRDMEII